MVSVHRFGLINSIVVLATSCNVMSQVTHCVFRKDNATSVYWSKLKLKCRQN